MDKNIIFALDIGTRSVVGLIAKKNVDDSLEVIDIEVSEHPGRSMIGGQIHDVPTVVKIVADIKNKLEARLGFQLQEVAVAAAGRSLLTTYGRSEIAFPFPKEITEELFYALQLEAVQEAQRQIQKIHKSLDYHCVGFSICHQYLDELPIGYLVGQIGTGVAIEIIATFLPRTVLDSLHSVIQRAGLKMNYITLEPIAAMNLAVPDSMRQLNVALIDIGAGTADIAISNNGTIQGYAMLPMAGDQITEALCQAHLLDFSTGESVKIQLQNQVDHISFKDITGTTHTYPKKQLLASISNSVTDLASNIAKKIKKVNGFSPQAILCIGGGSLTPTLPQLLAQALDLPETRVAVIGDEVTAPLTNLTDKLSSPQAVTPLAIGVDALYHRILEIISITVNDRPVRLFATQKVTVGDTLVAAGISPSKYLGKIGPALSLEVNGKIVFLKGDFGENGRITVNGREGNLTTLVQEGDTIVFTPGTMGNPGQGKVVDVLPLNLIDKKIKVNGLNTPLLSAIKLNGELITDLKTPIIDGCNIDFNSLSSIKDVIQYHGYDSMVLPNILVNGTPCQDYQQLLTPGDEIQIADAIDINEEETKSLQYIQIRVNEQEMDLPKPANNAHAILTDIFKIINFNPEQGRGKKLLLEVNGQDANFITPLKSGDNVTIKWIK